MITPKNKIYVIANQKGGVGKSTTCSCLAGALAEQGKRVLVVDLDPHSGLTTIFGFDFRTFSLTTYDYLSRPKDIDLKSLIVPTPVSKVALIPANRKLTDIESDLGSEIGWERFLKESIGLTPNEYDYILLDCPPTLGFLMINALVAAHQVIIPVQAEFMALRALVEFTDILKKVQNRGNPDLGMRILPTMFDGRTTHANDVIKELIKVYGDRVYNTAIKRTIKFADAALAGQTILQYAPQSEGAEAYRTLAKEILIINGENI